MTIDEMAKLEQEHKDRIANMTLEYEKGFIARAADFVLEKKRLADEIEKQQAELKSIAAGIEHNSYVKTDMDRVLEDLKREIAKNTAANLELVSNNAEAACAFSRQRQREEETLKDAELRLEGLISDIAIANDSIAKANEELSAKQEEVKAKGAEAAGYLAELAAIVKEAVAKKDALLTEVDELLVRRASLVESIQSARNDLDAINARIEAAKVAMAQADADLDKQRGMYAENIAKFKDLEALRSDIEAKQDDIKFREEQLLKRAKSLNEQEARIKQMKG